MKKLLALALALTFLLGLASCGINVRTGKTENQAEQETEESSQWFELHDGILTVRLPLTKVDYSWSFDTDDKLVELLTNETEGDQYIASFRSIGDGDANLSFVYAKDEDLSSFRSLILTCKDGEITKAEEASSVDTGVTIPGGIDDIPGVNIEGLTDADSILDSLNITPYVYSGDDEYLAITSEYIANIYGGSLPGTYKIPSVVILKTDDSDPEHIKLWCNSELCGYELEGDTLTAVSGSSIPGKFELEKLEDGYSVYAFETPRDGDVWQADVERICAGDKELLDKFENPNEDDMRTARIMFVTDYVTANEMDVVNLKNSDGTVIALAG